MSYSTNPFNSEQGKKILKENFRLVFAQDKKNPRDIEAVDLGEITGHFVDKNGDCYIDIFSCKSFDIETAKSVVNKYFSPKQIKVTYLTRQA